MDSTSKDEQPYDDVIYPTESPSEAENTCISDGPVVTKERTEINSELQSQPVPPPRLTRSRSTLRKRPSMTEADSNVVSRAVYVSQVQKIYSRKENMENDNSLEVPPNNNISNSQTTTVNFGGLTDTSGDRKFAVVENSQDSVETTGNQNLAKSKGDKFYVKNAEGHDLAENNCRFIKAEKEKDIVETVDSQDLANIANEQDCVNGADVFPIVEIADNQKFAGNRQAFVKLSDSQTLVQNEDGQNCVKTADNQCLTDTNDSEILLKTEDSQESEQADKSQTLSKIEDGRNYVKAAHDQNFGGSGDIQELPFMFERQRATNISDDQSSSNISDGQSTTSSTDNTAIEQEAEDDDKDVLAADRRTQSLSALHVKRPSSYSSDYATCKIYPDKEIQQVLVKKSVSMADDIGRMHIRNEGIPTIVNAEEAAENIHEPHESIGHDLIGEVAVANETDIEISSNGTSKEEDVQVNVPVTSGVHTLHIHLTFNFLQSYPESRLGRVNLKAQNKREVGKPKRKAIGTTGNSKATDELKKIESNTEDISTKAPGIPPKKPIVIPKASKTPEKPKVHRAQKAKSEGNLASSSSKKRSEKGKARSMVLSGNKVHDKQGTDERPKPSTDIVYDEILKEPNEPGYEGYSEANPDETQSNPQCLLRVPDSGSEPAWLFDHTQREAAQDTVNIEQDGSFFVIAEDKETIPFTPYTLMVVHDGQLIRIPVLKHQFIQNRMIKTKEKYSLASSPTQKLKMGPS